MITFGELERTGKESAVAYSGVLSWHKFEGTKKTHEILQTG
jgi:hypothetical protein